jgi:putative nucleotidyltransferase with HDIG domain
MRVKVLISVIVLAALLALLTPNHAFAPHWLLFAAYLAAMLLSAGMKVSLPSRDSTMSVNFPFIFLAIVQLSPRQAMAVAAISVFAQCKFRVKKLFSLVQIAFNVANAINATAAACVAFVALVQLRMPLAPALAAAAVIYFFVSTVPVALVISWSKDKPAFPLWRQNFLWFLPFYLVGAALSATAYFLVQHYGWLTGMLVLPVTYTIYRAYNAQMSRIRDQAQHIAEMEALHLRTIEGLAMAIEAKDQDTHDHLLRVRVYVTEIGKTMQLSGAEMEAVKTAALLHDIGKLAVPERIINKPGKLTQSEFETMKIHPAVGADILERVRFPYPVVPIVRSHHEWWNGMGYPDGLRGEAIPIGARILTVVDSFDAMASDRPYRRAMPLDEAMAIVAKLAGTQFDPRVVEILSQSYVELEAQARREGENLERLNTEVAVSRGVAPGAGFEQDSEEAANASASLNRGKGFALEKTGGTEFENHSPLRLIAAATEHVHTLLAATASPGYPLGLDDTLAVLVSRLSPLIPFACSVLYLKQGDHLAPQRLERAATRFFSTSSIPLGEGISGWAAHHQQSIVNGNATVEPNYLDSAASAGGLQSALAIPLRSQDRSVFGVLSFYAAPADAFSRDHLRALEAIETEITASLENALENAKAFREEPHDLSRPGTPLPLVIA